MSSYLPIDDLEEFRDGLANQSSAIEAEIPDPYREQDLLNMGQRLFMQVEYLETKLAFQVKIF